VGSYGGEFTRLGCASEEKIVSPFQKSVAADVRRL
jgi:hypothetical protein